jgi:hypothetical protein
MTKNQQGNASAKSKWFIVQRHGWSREYEKHACQLRLGHDGKSTRSYIGEKEMPHPLPSWQALCLPSTT